LVARVAEVARDIAAAHDRTLEEAVDVIVGRDPGDETREDILPDPPVPPRREACGNVVVESRPWDHAPDVYHDPDTGEIFDPPLMRNGDSIRLVPRPSTDTPRPRRPHERG
jgi:hypothetical protein